MLRPMPDFSEAIAHAQAHEVPWPRDPASDPARWGVHQSDPPPFNRLRGPVHSRGGVSGVIRIRGEVRPCERMDEAYRGLRDALAPMWGGGAWGEVLRGGSIAVGDSVSWHAELFEQ